LEKVQGGYEMEVAQEENEKTVEEQSELVGEPVLRSCQVIQDGA